ncbi:MAG: hypothetical protein IJX84_10170 [Clostridia bacterium]|nr:hypothetical protein [Clostridia bacterium]
MKKLIKCLPLLAVLALLGAMIFSKTPSNEERIQQLIDQHGFRPKESYLLDSDEPGEDGAYLSMTYGHLPGEVGDHWALMTFPSEKHGVGFDAQRMELVLFGDGEEPLQTFTYGQEELAAALTWSSETQNLSLTQRNELFLKRAITLGAPAQTSAGKTRFEPHDMATLVILVPWDDDLEGLGISITGVDDAGVSREFHNYMTLPEDGGGMF